MPNLNLSEEQMKYLAKTLVDVTENINYGEDKMLPEEHKPCYEIMCLLIKYFDAESIKEGGKLK